MSRSLKTSESLEIAENFQPQYDYIKHKRSVRISLQEFSPTTTLAAICETLSLILAQQDPPVYLERIYVSDNQISQLPAAFIRLCSAHLRTLDLHRNHLVEVPEFIASTCTNLEMLDLSSNRIASIPEAALFPLKSLRVLSLKDNHLTHLPAIVGEMISLESLAVSGNPLVFPSIEEINAMPGGINDLKAFLVSHTMSLDPKLDSVHLRPKLSHPTTPGLARARSLSDTRSRSSKASRRMGLIINSNKVTPDKAYSRSEESDVLTPSKPARKLSLPTEKSDAGVFPNENKPPNVVSAARARSFTHSEPMNSGNAHSNPGSPPRFLSASRSTKSAVNLSTRDQELSPEYVVEGDAKPAAYFRRLSILQETPSDEVQNGEKGETEMETAQPVFSGQEIETTPPKSAKKSSVSLQTTPNYPSQTQPSHTQTTRNGNVHENGVIVKVSRKILFSFSELHLSIKRFAGFCGDKRLSSKIVRLIQASKAQIDELVESMEAAENGEESPISVIDSLHACIQSFKTLLATMSDNYSSLVARIDTCFIRMVLLTLFGSLHELQNAHRLLNQPAHKVPPSLIRNASVLAPGALEAKMKQVSVSEGMMGEISLETPSISSASEAVATLEEIDERLYETIGLATTNAQVVFGDLTKTISKSAIATASNGSASISPSVASKFKELTNVCMTSMDITKRLLVKLSGIRSSQDTNSRRLFWDDINLFLKAVIQTFSAVKDIMRDAPIFNEVRGSMANLTKTTKELTIILEASSYKSISDSVASLPSNNSSNNVWHMSNGPPASSSAFPNPPQAPQATPISTLPPVRTPLEATVGTAAAQAILAQHDSQFSKSNPTDGVPPIMALNMPPSVLSDSYNVGLHTAPVQSMEQYYAKNVNPFDRL